MSEIKRVGVDLAKQVIQVHAVDSAGELVTNHHKFIAWCAQLTILPTIDNQAPAAIE